VREHIDEPKFYTPTAVRDLRLAFRRSWDVASERNHTLTEEPGRAHAREVIARLCRLRRNQSFEARHLRACSLRLTAPSPPV